MSCDGIELPPARARSAVTTDLKISDRPPCFRIGLRRRSASSSGRPDREARSPGGRTPTRRGRQRGRDEGRDQRTGGEEESFGKPGYRLSEAKGLAIKSFKIQTGPAA